MQNSQYQYWKASTYSILTVFELGPPVSESSTGSQNLMPQWFWTQISEIFWPKTLISSPPLNCETLISSLFFYFKKKNCSHHHRHHFHLCFYRVLSIGWGRWFFVKKLEKEELNIKHFWCGMGWRVFESNFIARGEDSCFLKYFN